MVSLDRDQALDAAAPDATGTRWAVAARRERIYLAARFPDGREVVEIKRRADHWRPALRVTHVPWGLLWKTLP